VCDSAWGWIRPRLAVAVNARVCDHGSDGMSSLGNWCVVVHVISFEVDNSFTIAKWVSHFEIFAKKRLAAQVNVAI
jgi:hypothetical protein